MDTTLPAIAPFRIGVSDAEIVAHEGWERARTRMLALIEAGTPRIGLLGPPGTGKSLLLRHLAATLPPGAVIFVDDAGRLDPETLATQPPPCVLAGLPGFADRLALLRPPAALVWLQPLGPEQVARFVAARLAMAHQPRDALTPGAVLELARHSGGTPRLINALASAAFFTASCEGAAQVTARHVQEAASFREPAFVPEPTRQPDEAPAAEALARAPIVARSAPSQQRRPILALLAASAIAVGAVWALLPPPHPARPIPTPQTTSSPAPVTTPMPPPAPAPTPPAPAPSAPPPPVVPHPARIVLQARPADASAAYDMAAQLRPSFGPVETRLVPATPRAPSIRYFFPEDARTARDLAATLASTGQAWRVQSFTTYRPLPRPGTIEVWIP